jgi:hypothetical protein
MRIQLRVRDLEKEMKRVLSIVALSAVAAGLGLAVAQPANAANNASEGSGSTVIGFDWVDAHHGGSQLTSWGNANCTTTVDDVDYGFSSLPGGWNDIISSTTATSNCYQKLFEDIRFNGTSPDPRATEGFSGTTDYVGDAMNDRTSSIQFS